MGADQGELVLDIGLLGDCQGVIDFDAELADGAVDLGVAEQQLHRTEVTCSFLNQSGLRAADRMSAEHRRIEADSGDPS
jgi:hypothetical protein